MRDKAVYNEVEQLRYRRRSAMLSQPALEVHVRAVAHSVRTQCPAFISDDAVDALAPGRVTTMAALELCLAGLWDRARDGYVISDLTLIEHLSAGPLRRAGWRLRRRTRTTAGQWLRSLNSDHFVSF